MYPFLIFIGAVLAYEGLVIALNAWERASGGISLFEEARLNRIRILNQRGDDD